MELQTNATLALCLLRLSFHQLNWEVSVSETMVNERPETRCGHSMLVARASLWQARTKQTYTGRFETLRRSGRAKRRRTLGY
jgi:hypothetical protein